MQCFAFVCLFYCLSNAVHGQNINLPVYVSMCTFNDLLSVQCYAMHGQNIHSPVCVSMTLSVNSPTGQTPQRMFTVDSLTDADLRNDVPFVGLDDE